MGIGQRVRRLPQWVMWRSGINRFARAQLVGDGRFVVAFHGVAAERHPQIGSAHPHHSADEFRFTLSWIAERFGFLTPEQFFEESTPGVLLTFDDGLNNNFEVALPILEQFEAPGLFFVTTQHVDEPANWLDYYRELAIDEWGSLANVPAALGQHFYNGVSAGRLRDVAAHPLVTIGGHTASHPFLTKCSDRELAFELAESRRRLQQITGRPIATFAYPTNDYDRRVALAVRAAGYKAAFAVWSKNVGVRNYEIRRIGLYKSSAAYLDGKLNGIYQRPYHGPAVNYH